MAVLGMGTKLFVGATGTDFVAQLTEISGLEVSSDTVETTTLEATGGFRTYVQGLKDAGEVSISGYFNPDDTVGQGALWGNLQDGSVDAYRIEFPSALGAKWAFNAIVTGYTTGAAMEDLISFEATLKITGVPTLTIV